MAIFRLSLGRKMGQHIQHNVSENQFLQVHHERGVSTTFRSPVLENLQHSVVNAEPSVRRRAATSFMDNDMVNAALHLSNNSPEATMSYMNFHFTGSVQWYEKAVKQPTYFLVPLPTMNSVNLIKYTKDWHVTSVVCMIRMQQARNEMFVACRSAKELQEVVSAAEKYIPYIAGFVDAYNPAVMFPKKKQKRISFVWHSQLLRKLPSSRAFVSENPRLELIFVLFTYAALLVNMASYLVVDNLDQAADAMALYHKAASVFYHIAMTQSPLLLADESFNIASIPMEANARSNLGLAQFCRYTAQRIQFRIEHQQAAHAQVIEVQQRLSGLAIAVAEAFDSGVIEINQTPHPFVNFRLGLYVQILFYQHYFEALAYQLQGDIAVQQDNASLARACYNKALNCLRSDMPSYVRKKLSPLLKMARTRLKTSLKQAIKVRSPSLIQASISMITKRGRPPAVALPVIDALSIAAPYGSHFELVSHFFEIQEKLTRKQQRGGNKLGLERSKSGSIVRVPVPAEWFLSIRHRSEMQKTADEQLSMDNSNESLDSSQMNEMLFVHEMQGLIRMHRHDLKQRLAVHTALTHFYCVIRHSFLFVYPKEAYNQANGTLEGKVEPVQLISLDGCTVARVFNEKFAFNVVVGNNKTYCFFVDSLAQLHTWLNAIYHAAWMTFPLASFADVRYRVRCKPLIDGQEAFSEIADAMEGAATEILICGWSITPCLYLKRLDSGVSLEQAEYYRLDRLLKRKASQGVQIRVLIWNEPNIGPWKLKSAGVKLFLENLHGNIQVVRHRADVDQFAWSHHQKSIVVDQAIAFIGGLDLTIGRYDTPRHNITDESSINLVYPGKDYYNQHVAPFSNPLNPWKDNLDRSYHPRFGFHDVVVKMTGSAAIDATFNFIQRWNFLKDNGQPLVVPRWADPVDDLSVSLSSMSPLAESMSSPSESPVERAPSSMIAADQSTTTDTAQTEFVCETQVVRSLCEWSGGGRTEVSLYMAIVDLITHAQHFVYIETELFISNTNGDAENMVGDVLLQKVRTAIRQQTKFKIIMVLPVEPEYADMRKASSSRLFAKYVFGSINRGGTSIIEQLQSEFPSVTISDYISFHSLRAFGKIAGRLVHEQVFVHSNVVLVDDLACVIGSGNINDRSLAGDRDSELAVVIKDSQFLQSSMNRQSYKAGRFAHSLRRRLMAEHIGLQPDDPLLTDPLDDQCLQQWMATSSRNTVCLSNVFPGMPADAYTKISQWPARDTPANAEHSDLLEDVRGHLVDFPHSFLLDATLQASVASLANTVNASFFQ